MSYTKYVPPFIQQIVDDALAAANAVSDPMLNDDHIILFNNSYEVIKET